MILKNRNKYAAPHHFGPKSMARKMIVKICERHLGRTLDVKSKQI